MRADSLDSVVSNIEFVQAGEVLAEVVIELNDAVSLKVKHQ